MIASPIACVIDASVLIKLVVSETDSDKVRALFDHLVLDPAAQFHVPEFCLLECTNILWKQARKKILSISDANLKLQMMRGLALQIEPLGDLLDPALNMAASLDVSAYDATYLAASSRLGLPLITADDKLFRKAAAVYPNIVLPSNLVVPPLPPGTNP
ncbi:MAG: type II toxin-antitoxin system VapC family toxin [Planctomycetia bacterium]|nr:type II toxin-antitoxin system VapC family toxin [Planctomycetia bacterium]